MPDVPETQNDEMLDDPFEVRRAKRASMIAAGDEPYPSGFPVDTRVSELQERFKDLEDGESTGVVVTVAGRLIAKRDQGKLAFLVIRDATGDIQLFTRINVLGEDAFALVKDFDLGDWIGATGEVIRTRRGELSISPTEVKLLSKSLRPLPEKFHGLSDVDTRYRQRYVDLIANPEVKETFIMRSRILRGLRAYAESQGYMEVETPMLHPIPGGATARPFITHHNTLDMDLYLRIAPELYLKRLLVGGFERVFEINRSFRNEGMSVRHNPEFTMLEAYQAYGDVNSMMDFTQGAIQAAAQEACGSLDVTYQGQEIHLGGEWRRATMLELLNERLGDEIDRPISFDLSIEELRSLCERYDVKVDKSFGKGKLITELYEETVEHTLIQPTFVCEHPTETSPLARKKPDDENVTERFELLIAGREYANAFSELNDPVDQEERFAAQIEAKNAGDDEAMGYDEDYIRALEYGMPPAGGMGMGIDRLVMLLTDSPSIRDVLLFPQMRPEA